MPGNPRTLTGAQWALMHAIELGKLDLETLDNDLRTLRQLGLVEFQNAWHPTEEGRLLIALRRQI
jgi:hypothetical protein